MQCEKSGHLLGRVKIYFNADGYFSETTDYISMKENEKIWHNVSLYPMPSENSVICGYVRDEISKKPVKEAEIYLKWEEGKHEYWNYTSTNESGFYSLNVAKGELYLSFSADGYFGEHMDNVSVGENERIWLNISLYPIPEENALLCGYVKDEEGKALQNASVYLTWEDNKGNEMWNYTETDENGFYSFHVAPGRIKLDFFADCYNGKSSNYYTIKENETLWVNATLKKGDVG